MKIKYFSLLIGLLFIQVSYADISKTVLPESKLIEWKLIEDNFELKLVQRLPDQTRSFFEGRGFSKNITNNIANSCVFQTIGRNNSKDKQQTIHVSLKKWFIKIDQQRLPIKLKETWDKQWNDEQVNSASRLAFRWATFPTEQSFEPNGDYNWGMISFGPQPGSVFDLYIEWQSNDQTKNAWIKNIMCPKDR